MSDWTLESGIPIPPPNFRGGGCYKQRISEIGLALRDMEVGQSIFSKTIPRQKMTSICSSITQNYAQKYVSRAMDGGTRIWRVE